MKLQHQFRTITVVVVVAAAAVVVVVVVVFHTIQTIPTDCNIYNPNLVSSFVF